MKHYDYEWDLNSEGIVLDEELNTDRLGWRGGDLFQLININGRQFMKKVGNVEQFLLKGAMSDEQIK